MRADGWAKEKKLSLYRLFHSTSYLCNMYQLAVIGAGQLGSRHLQGLAKANLEAEIWVVDVSQESLNIAQSRYNEVKSDKMKVHFITDFSKIASEKIDFAIGYSMGGFNAIIFSTLFKVKKVIALSPQFSIHPKQLLHCKFSSIY